MFNFELHLPSDSQVKRYNELWHALTEARRHDHEVVFRCSFTEESVKSMENLLVERRRQIAEYYSARTNLIRFFGEFLP